MDRKNESKNQTNDKREIIRIDNLSNYKVNKDDLEDGYNVDGIPELENKLCLIDTNMNVITPLPEEYQNTPMYIYPNCGAYSEGLIMVSTMANPELQYFHRLNGAAGLWGWIDTDFKTIIEPQFIFAENFYNGYAMVCKGSWDINSDGEYWCDNERWGIIDKNMREFVPCIFDELFEIECSQRYFLGHLGGWDNGYNCIYDADKKREVVKLDFDFDNGYMFNDCFYDNENIIFSKHIPGGEVDYVYIYSLKENKWIAHNEPVKGRELNGETKIVVNKDGKDIIVF